MKKLLQGALLAAMMILSACKDDPAAPVLLRIDPATTGVQVKRIVSRLVPATETRYTGDAIFHHPDSLRALDVGEVLINDIPLTRSFHHDVGFGYMLHDSGATSSLMRFDDRHNVVRIAGGVAFPSFTDSLLVWSSPLDIASPNPGDMVERTGELEIRWSGLSGSSDSIYISFSTKNREKSVLIGRVPDTGSLKIPGSRLALLPSGPILLSLNREISKIDTIAPGRTCRISFIDWVSTEATLR